MRPGPPPTPGQGGIPLTEEWFRAQKKALKEAGMDKYNSAEGPTDAYQASEAAAKLPATKEEKFLDGVMPQLLDLDENSETFFDDATQKLVGGALSQEFGEEIQKKPGFPQMQDKITRTILNDEHYRDVIHDFLSCVLEVKGRGPESEPGGEGGGAPPGGPPGTRVATDDTP